MKKATLIFAVCGLVIGLALASAMWLWPRAGPEAPAPLWPERPLAEDDPAWPLVAAVMQWRNGRPDPETLASFRIYWPLARIHPMLVHEHERVRHSAVLALAFVGERGCIDALMERLRDEAMVVRRVADRALWQIWFRLGSDTANHWVREGARAIQAGAAQHAFMVLGWAIEDSPGFAEAYNQRAILHFSVRDYAASSQDCRRALQRMPRHYGALAGLGRCLMHLGRDAEAIEMLKKARQINPNLNLDGTIRALESRVSVLAV